MGGEHHHGGAALRDEGGTRLRADPQGLLAGVEAVPPEALAHEQGVGRRGQGRREEGRREEGRLKQLSNSKQSTKRWLVPRSHPQRHAGSSARWPRRNSL